MTLFDAQELTDFSLAASSSGNISTCSLLSLRALERPHLCLPAEYLKAGCKEANSSRFPRGRWGLAT